MNSVSSVQGNVFRREIAHRLVHVSTQVLPGKGVWIAVCSYSYNIGQIGTGCSASGTVVGVFSVCVFEKELYLHWH